MKKSNKQFSVTVDGKTTDVGTRSGVANHIRQLLENAEGGKDIDLKIGVKDVVEPKPTPEAPKAE